MYGQIHCEHWWFPEGDSKICADVKLTLWRYNNQEYVIIQTEEEIICEVTWTSTYYPMATWLFDIIWVLVRPSNPEL